MMSRHNRKAAMSTSQQISLAARAIRQGFEKGIPFLQFSEGEKAVVLCRRRAGEEIEHPDCEFIVEALDDGVFKRFTKHSGDKTSFIFMGIAPYSPGDEWFSHLLEGLDDLSLEVLPMDVAHQVLQFEAAQARQKAREASRQNRSFGM
jgi:hypothetical protein